MRLILAVSIGIGSLALTACSKTQQSPPATPVATNTLSTGESETATTPSDDTADGEHKRASDHGRDEREAGNHHGSPQAGHHGKDQSDGSAHGPRQHGHGGHGHSTEQHVGHDSQHILVGDKVPDFEVTIDGEKFMLSDLQKNTAITEDGVLVLTFWCSFCHSCRDVERRLNELSTEYRGKVGVIALNASAGETAEKVSAFANENELTLPIALNANGTAADIFGARVTTTTVVIDGGGVLRYCGQFGDDQHAFAADALSAVLAGKEVQVKKTKHKG